MIGAPESVLFRAMVDRRLVFRRALTVVTESSGRAYVNWEEEGMLAGFGNAGARRGTRACLWPLHPAVSKVRGTQMVSLLLHRPFSHQSTSCVRRRRPIPFFTLIADSLFQR